MSTVRPIDESPMPWATTKKNNRKEKTHSLFEWIQLIATVCVPITIGVLSVLQHQSQMEQHANDKRIAAENRLKDIEIAHQNRANDQWLADDKQKEDVLVDYQNFLAELLSKNGLMLNNTLSARSVARFKTLMALSQLNPTRRAYLLRWLYELKLITIHPSESEFMSIIDLSSADFSRLTFDMLPKSDTFCSRTDFARAPPQQRTFFNLVLPSVDLTSASLHNVALIGGFFDGALMDNVSFECSRLRGFSIEHGLSFERTSLVGARLDKIVVSNVSFYAAKLDRASLRESSGYDWKLQKASLVHADLSDNMFQYESHIRPVDCSEANLTEARLVNSFFQQLNFRAAIFDRANLTYAQMHSCQLGRASDLKAASFRSCIWTRGRILSSSFDYAEMSDCEMSHIYIEQSNLTNVNLNKVNFSGASLYTSRFDNAQMIGCTMTGANLHRSTFIGTNFIGCQGLTFEQLTQATNIFGAILPNGTKVT